MVLCLERISGLDELHEELIKSQLYLCVDESLTYNQCSGDSRVFLKV